MAGQRGKEMFRLQWAVAAAAGAAAATCSRAQPPSAGEGAANAENSENHILQAP